MVVDHAHMNTTPESSATAISATVTSGIRSIFCYTPINAVAYWNPLTFDNRGMLAPWVIQTFSSLASRAPFGPNGRVALGLAFDGWFLPAEAASPLFAEATKHSVQFLTGHMTRGVTGHPFSLPALLVERGLLGEKREDGGEYAPFKTVLLSHATGATSEDLAVAKQHGAHVASTPGTELQMGLGWSICFDEEARDIACLGGDCLANGGSSIIGEMRLGLQAERARRNQRTLDRGLAPGKLHSTVEEAFNLGTIKGARAAGMADKLGSLAVGKLADLVVFEGNSPSMVCAAQHDPVAAIVLHSNPRDISTVIVDGLVRKRHGQLLDMEVDEDSKRVIGKDTVRWKDVARELLKSRGLIQSKVEKIDFTEAQQAWMKSWYIDASKIVDHV
ncbi:5-methylthioadenosine/S-adenosylhomocysteine deaminase [Neofusicoccum parvum]|uniref:5-methylthioadenosine/S-adenosylhomocysteine deaminase n=1 Tax=Neofusicoccum parvum TaxID=310453 RepID=A0ACB5SPG0_9PEZI|nr:5-methylthioadenosine/S-adenosylhomocysteine deaminase [Neofusicoccum parvum]